MSSSKVYLGINGVPYILGVFSSLPTVPRTRVSSQQKVRRKKIKTVEQENRDTFEVTIGPPKLTRFERARIIGARSLQLALGAPPFIKVQASVNSPIDIAVAELDQKILPINIRRTLPDGQYEDIPLDILIGQRSRWCRTPQRKRDTNMI